MANKDYYQLLGVNRNASEKELKTAYRNLAKQYHLLRLNKTACV